MNVVVVGAGVSGLMAAEVLATARCRVTVYDQRRSPARKFVLAGRGGLNLTHSEPLDRLLDRYGSERIYLEQAVRAFTPTDLRTWCAGLGHETFVGTSGRVFPNEFGAVPLLRSWLRRLRTLGVALETQHRWAGWDEGRSGLRFSTPSGDLSVPYDAAVLALGGGSWPKVSSDGSWQQTLMAHGVDVHPLRAANCGVVVPWTEVMIERFEGTPIKNCAVVVPPAGGEKDADDPIIIRGDLVITRNGLEGGPIYGHSRRIREHLEQGSCQISIDLCPDLQVVEVAKRLPSKQDTRETKTKWLKRCGFSPAAISLLREATGNHLPADSTALAELAKSVPVTVGGLAGIDRAISSSGGVAWECIDPNFQIRHLPNVYAVGEMLDWEAPTGGYLLQACFSIARVAAKAIVEQGERAP